MAYATIEEAIDKIREGGFVIVVDEEGDTASGDLVLAAEFADTAVINQMMQIARGLLCVALTPKRIEELETAQAEIATKLADPAFYQNAPAEVPVAKQRLEAIEQEVATAFARWEELEALRVASA